MKTTIEINKDIEVPKIVYDKWQDITNMIAKFVNVPVSLIMRADKSEIEVFVSSKTKGNPYKKGERAEYPGLYCETVLKTDNSLLVKNALKSMKWKNNPDIKLDMISYLGYPLKWPDGKKFGTLCVLDAKENSYNKEIKNLIQTFKELVEFHLDLIQKSHNHKINLSEIRKNVETYYNTAITRELEIIKLKKQIAKLKKNNKKKK